MIKVYDITSGENVFLNPRYITSVLPFRSKHNDGKSRRWVVGNSGYGTYSIITTLTPSGVNDLIKDSSD